MARSARSSRRSSAKSGVRIDLSKVGKAFEPGKEYAVKIVECTLEDGTKAPYFNLKLAGVEDEYENSFMYHKASTSESSLWRLRPLMDAFGMEIPDGPMDISAEDFVGLTAMCSTYLERWDGGSSVRPDEFWPLEDSDVTDDEDEEEEEKPAKKSKRKAKEEEPEEDEDEEEEKPARKSRKSRSKPAEDEEDEEEQPKSRKSKRKPVDEDDEDEEEEQPKSKAKGKSKKKASISEDELNEMNEDELADLIEQHDLDVDLDDHKTLRKKRNAVLDALEEAGLLD